MDANNRKSIPNIINLRMKQCPYYPDTNIQQIIGYGRWEDEKQTNSSIISPLLIIYAKMFETKAKKKDGKHFRDELIELIKQNLKNYKSGLKNENEGFDTKIDQEICLLKKGLGEIFVSKERNEYEHLLCSPIDWSNLTKGGSFPLRSELRKYTPLTKNQYELCGEPLSEEPVHFSMAVCIRDEPGTLHRVLELLGSNKQQIEPTSSFQQKRKDAKKAFWFNIDYILTDYLSLYNLYHLQLYATYRDKWKIVKYSDEERKENIQALAFYHKRENKIPEWINNFGLNPVKCPRNNIQDHFSHMRMAGDVKISHHVEVSAFHREKFSIFDNSRFRPILNCPVSRVAGCPKMKKEIARRKPERSKKNHPVKFHVITQDKEGALKKFIELVGVGEFPSKK